MARESQGLLQPLAIFITYLLASIGKIFPELISKGVEIDDAGIREGVFFQ
jgi:hypothetical protein